MNTSQIIDLVVKLTALVVACTALVHTVMTARQLAAHKSDPNAHSPAGPPSSPRPPQ